MRAQRESKKEQDEVIVTRSNEQTESTSEESSLSPKAETAEFEPMTKEEQIQITEPIKATVTGPANMEEKQRQGADLTPETSSEAPNQTTGVENSKITAVITPIKASPPNNGSNPVSARPVSQGWYKK